jgi:hypothetical protein
MIPVGLESAGPRGSRKLFAFMRSQRAGQIGPRLDLALL